MSQRAAARSVSDEQLLTVLRPLAMDKFGKQIDRFERRFSAYSSSFTIEEIDLVLADGAVAPLIFKDLSPGAVLDVAKGKRPDRMSDPFREIEIYQTLLEREDLDTPRYYASVCDPESKSFWLFIERIDGLQLSHVGEFEVWQRAARWLARLHALSLDPNDKRLPSRSLAYDHAYFDAWIQRCRNILGEAGRENKEVERILSAYSRVIEDLLSAHACFIHGEFYSSNVLVERPDREDAIRVIDWEWGGLGPAVIDVATLASGAWNDSQRSNLVDSYLEELSTWGVGAPDRERFDRLVEAARLYVAVKWMGWAPGWTPPAEHGQDWWAEALIAIERLGL